LSESAGLEKGIANENANSPTEEDSESHSDAQDIEMKETGSNAASAVKPTED
jgi:hypothetical protein